MTTKELILAEISKLDEQELAELHTLIKNYLEAKVEAVNPTRKPRKDWAEQFRQMAILGDDKLLDAELPTSTQWDKDEWEW